MDAFDDILKTSGNSHHASVVMKFRDLGWDALVSPYYSDNITDKSREIDVIVHKEYPVVGPFSDVRGSVRVRLFLECKYISQDTILWFDNKDMTRTRSLIDSSHGTETHRYQQRANDFHYGQNVPVAKLFGSKKQNEENEVFSRAISQCLNGYIYYKGKNTATESKSSHSSNITTISYPVIVCNSFERLRRVSMSDTTQMLKVIDHPFQLEVNYAYLDSNKQSRNEFFLIDVITTDMIEGYIEKLATTDVKEKHDTIETESFNQRFFPDDSDVFSVL